MLLSRRGQKLFQGLVFLHLGPRGPKAREVRGFRIRFLGQKGEVHSGNHRKVLGTIPPLGVAPIVLVSLQLHNHAFDCNDR